MVNFAGAFGAAVDRGDLDGEHEPNGLGARRAGAPRAFLDGGLQAEQPGLGRDEIVLQFRRPGGGGEGGGTDHRDTLAEGPTREMLESGPLTAPTSGPGIGLHVPA